MCGLLLMLLLFSLISFLSASSYVCLKGLIEELGTHELFTNYGFDFSRYKRMLSVISQKPCKDEDDLVLSGVAQTCDDNHVNEDDKVIFEESRTSYASKDETDLMLSKNACDNSASSKDGGDEEPQRKKLRWSDTHE
ncbi:hypothetical protein OROMI_009600 [Orobanche minor]